MAKVQTIRIQHPGFPDGYVIGAADFDPAIHRRFDDAPESAPPAEGGDVAPEGDAAPPEAASAPKRGRKAR